MRLLFEQGLSVTEIWKTLYPDKSKSTVYKSTIYDAEDIHETKNNKYMKNIVKMIFIIVNIFQNQIEIK